VRPEHGKRESVQFSNPLRRFFAALFETWVISSHGFLPSIPVPLIEKSNGVHLAIRTSNLHHPVLGTAFFKEQIKMPDRPLNSSRN
jgi:hypothetical protein